MNEQKQANSISKADIESAYINTQGVPQSHGENVKSRQNTVSLANKERMSEMGKARQAHIAELKAKGEYVAPVRNPQQKFLDDPRPLRAIRRFCYECNGFNNADATNCQNRDCALWLFRRGSSVIKGGELEIWQAKHKAWLERCGELNNETEEVGEE